MQMIRVMLMWMTVALAAGCGSNGSGDPSSVQGVSRKDPDMLAAIARAQAEVQTFIDAIHDGNHTQHVCTYKQRFEWQGEGEYIWINDVTFDGHKLHGTITEDALYVPGVKRGQAVEITPSEISDWMIIDRNSHVKGGYTVRVIRDKMTPQERAKYDQQQGLIYD